MLDAWLVLSLVGEELVVDKASDAKDTAANVYHRLDPEKFPLEEIFRLTRVEGDVGHTNYPRVIEQLQKALEATDLGARKVLRYEQAFLEAASEEVQEEAM